MRDGKRPDNLVKYHTRGHKFGEKYDRTKYSISGDYIRPRQNATPTKFTDEEKAKCIAIYACIPEHGMAKVGQHLGLVNGNLYHWVNGQYISEGALAMAHDYKERIKEKFENILELALDVMPEKVDKASFWDLARASSLAFDKIQLMEGKPTTINGTLPSDERSNKIIALMEQAKQRQLQAQIIDVPTSEEELVPCIEANSTLKASDADEWEAI